MRPEGAITKKVVVKIVKMLKNVRSPWVALLIVVTWITALLIVFLVEEINIYLVLGVTFLITLIFSKTGFSSPD